jgi:hypothetical protein
MVPTFTHCTHIKLRNTLFSLPLVPSIPSTSHKKSRGTDSIYYEGVIINDSLSFLIILSSPQCAISTNSDEAQKDLSALDLQSKIKVAAQQLFGKRGHGHSDASMQSNPRLINKWSFRSVHITRDRLYDDIRTQNNPSHLTHTNGSRLSNSLCHSPLSFSLIYIGKSRSEKLAWCREKREEGNNLYKKKMLTQALDCYVISLTGLDFGNTEEEKKEAVLQVQVPVLCNMAACWILMKDWGKAEEICTQALTLDPLNHKALARRGTARCYLGRVALAREDLQTLELHCRGTGGGEKRELEEGVSAQIDKLARLVESTTKRQQDNLESRKSTAKKMFSSPAGLYDDKSDVKEPNPVVNIFVSAFNLVKDAVARVLLWVFSTCLSPNREIEAVKEE